MSTQVVNYDKDTLSREIQELSSGFTLYSGSTEWQQLDCLAGRSEWFPPDASERDPKTNRPIGNKGKLLPHPTEIKDGEPVLYLCNGRKEIKHRFGNLREKPTADYPLGKKEKIVARGVPVPGEDIKAQMMFLLGRRTANGQLRYPFLRWLKGDKTDPKNMADARDAWEQSQLQWARSVDADRKRYVEKFKREYPGAMPDAPTDKQRKASSILRGFATKSNWKQFVCKYQDDFDTDVASEYIQHMQEIHGETVQVELKN